MPQTNSTIATDSQAREELDLKIPQNVSSEQIYRYWRALANMINKSYINKYINKDKAFEMMDGFAKIPDDEKYTALHDLHRLYEEMVDDFRFVRSRMIVDEYKEFVVDLSETIPEPFRLKFVEYMVNGQDLPVNFLVQIKDYIENQSKIENAPHIEYRDVLSTLDKIKRTPLNAGRPGFNQAFTPEQIASLIEEDPSKLNLNDSQNDFEVPIAASQNTVDYSSLESTNPTTSADFNFANPVTSAPVSEPTQSPKIIYTNQNLNNTEIAPLKTISKTQFNQPQNQPKTRPTNLKSTYFLVVWTTFNTLFKQELVLGTQTLTIETGQNKAKAVWLNDKLQNRVYQLLNQKIQENNYKVTASKVYLDRISLISFCSQLDLNNMIEELKTYILLTLSAELKINPQENKLWNDDFYKIELDSPQKLTQAEKFLQQ